jgi:hypothetical protein
MSTLSGGPNIVTNGLVLYLDAANPRSYVSGSTAWNDLSQGGNNGTLVNNPAFSSANGGSLVFDGVSNYVTIPSSSLLNTLTQFTYMAYVNISSSDNYGAIISRNTSLVWYAGRTVIGQRLFIGGSTTGDSNTFLPSNRYAFICTTWDGTTIRYYFNGAPDGTAVNTLSAFNTTPITIGRYQTGEYFQGNINLVGIYTRTLSAQEILQNYNSTKTRFGL